MKASEARKLTDIALNNKKDELEYLIATSVKGCISKIYKEIECATKKGDTHITFSFNDDLQVLSSVAYLVNKQLVEDGYTIKKLEGWVIYINW